MPMIWIHLGHVLSTQQQRDRLFSVCLLLVVTTWVDIQNAICKKNDTQKRHTHSFRIASDKSAIKAINNLNKTWIHVKRTNQMHQEPPWANQHGCSLRSLVNAEKHFIQRITQTLTVTEQLNDASRWKYICTCIRFLFLFTPDSLVSTSPPLGY